MMAVVFVISYLLGAGILIAALLAIIVGWSLSFLLLKPYADAATQWFAQRKTDQDEGRTPRFTAQIAADEAEEDALIADAQRDRESGENSQGEGDSEAKPDGELD